MNKNKPSTLPKGFNRLERMIAHLGLASRREAKALITKGFISVNGKVVKEPGFGVLPTRDMIKIDQKNIPQKESILVYKKRGIETNKTNRISKDLHDEFPRFRFLYPIGRLDKESEGLIIMSNDGTLSKALTGENSSVEKEYVVTVRETVSDSILAFMSKGIVLDGIRTKASPTKKISPHSFSIILREGRKHQIRRMCDVCRLTIEKLVRVRIGKLTLRQLQKKSFIVLSEKDVTGLKLKNI